CEEALTLTKSIALHWCRCSALSKVAVAMANKQDERVNSILNDVRTTIASIVDHTREYTFDDLATALAEMGRFDDALALVDSLPIAFEKTFALREIAFSMAKAKDYRAEQILNEAHLTDVQ